MNLKNTCPRCGNTWYTKGLSGIPMWIIFMIPWAIGVIDIVQNLMS
jgi:hypothetical protein